MSEGRAQTEGRVPVVFFVDDEAGIRGSFSTLMRRRGFQVLEAGSAEEAGRLIEIYRDPIDVLLMDINLPDGWGATLAQALLEEHPEMTVIYTTGYADEDPILSGALNDAPFVLRKPFSSEELLELIRRAMGDAERKSGGDGAPPGS
jgi:DNA-binding NtrC family response regulator